MGSLCSNKSQQDKPISTTQSMKEGVLTISNLSKNDIGFWMEMKETGMMVIDKITSNSIEFKHDSVPIENIVSFSTVLDLLLREQNFFFLIPTYEMLLGLIDFIELTMKLKEKYSKEYFFLIDFSKFYLARDDANNFAHLLYLDKKLNEHYELPEIMINEDRSFFNSITGSMIEGSNMKMLSSLSSLRNDGDLSKTVDNENLNGMFYSYCKEQYSNLKGAFSYEECDNFYANCFLSFITNVLFKKVPVNVAEYDKAYQNLKKIMRYSFNKKFLENQIGRLTLKKLKEVMVNFYLNNQEFLKFKSLIEIIISSNTTDSYSYALANLEKLKLNQADSDSVKGKVQEYVQSKIGIVYGNCLFDTDDVRYHSLQFCSEKYTMKEDKGMCIQCMQMILKRFFDKEDNPKDYASIKEFTEAFEKDFPDLKRNIEDILRFYCIAFDNNIKGEMGKVDKSRMKIYEKETGLIMFDLNDINIQNKDTFFLDDIVNIDLRAKHSFDAFKLKRVPTKTSSKK